MAPHSSTIAWKIPWMEEPGRLQSMRSLRVRHEWSDLAAAVKNLAYVCIYIYTHIGFSDSSFGKESACNAGDPGYV